MKQELEGIKGKSYIIRFVKLQDVFCTWKHVVSKFGGKPILTFHSTKQNFATLFNPIKIGGSDQR